MGKAGRPMREQLNLGQQSKSLALERIKEVGHTGLNLNQKGLQEEFKVTLVCESTLNADNV